MKKGYRAIPWTKGALEGSKTSKPWSVWANLKAAHRYAKRFWPSGYIICKYELEGPWERDYPGNILDSSGGSVSAPIGYIRVGKPLPIGSRWPILAGQTLVVGESEDEGLEEVFTEPWFVEGEKKLFKDNVIAITEIKGGS